MLQFRGLITQPRFGEGFAICWVCGGLGLFAVRQLLQGAVLRSRQEAVFRLVRWPCFGRAGCTSAGLAVFWYGRGCSLLAQNLVRWRKRTLPPGNHPLIQRAFAKDFSTMNCNGWRYGLCRFLNIYNFQMY